jgi:hypothetical protein
MNAIMVPPTYYPPILIAGNYEPDDINNEIICPYCHRPSGWDKSLWSEYPPENGFFCNICGENFLIEGENND